MCPVVTCMLAASKVCIVCGCWQTLDTSPETINPVVYVDQELPWESAVTPKISFTMEALKL